MTEGLQLIDRVVDDVATSELPDVSSRTDGLGKVTLFEALAAETPNISIDGLGRTTMQGTVDFDD